MNKKQLLENYLTQYVHFDNERNGHFQSIIVHEGQAYMLDSQIEPLDAGLSSKIYDKDGVTHYVIEVMGTVVFKTSFDINGLFTLGDDASEEAERDHKLSIKQELLRQFNHTWDEVWRSFVRKHGFYFEGGLDLHTYFQMKGEDLG